MTTDPSSSRRAAMFPTTTWTFIQTVQDRQHDDFVPALNRFISAYWKPIFCFLRAKGCPLHKAEDVTQEFFLRFLEGDLIRRADPQRGRFRTFLLTLLTRFLSDQGPQRAPRQQRFEQQLVSIQSLVGDEERSYEPPAHETPETVFMKQWARAIVESGLKQLQQMCADEGRSAWYDVFAATHFTPAGAKPASQQAVGERFGMTCDQVRYALEQAQQRLRQVLQAEVRDQVGAEEEVEGEVRDLLSLLES